MLFQLNSLTFTIIRYKTKLEATNLKSRYNFIYREIDHAAFVNMHTFLKKWQDAGYAFIYKVFTDLGHGGLAGEHPKQFFEEVTKAHENSLKNKS